MEILGYFQKKEEKENIYHRIYHDFKWRNEGYKKLLNSCHRRKKNRRIKYSRKKSNEKLW